MSVAAKINALFSHGAVPFERFMQTALYDSEVGYYSNRIRSVGARGDFSTAATLHPILGEAIATWLKSLRKSPLQSFHVIEIGAGTGELAKTILDKLGFLARRRMHYHIVEVSEPLKEIQKETLKGRSVYWHADMNAALAACDGAAYIFSNELPDAFPCRIFVKTGAQWSELALELREGNPFEVLIPISSSEKILEKIVPHSFPDGQRIEIQESYRTWLKSWLPTWRRGEMLTIDYGDTFPGLYDRRPRGTIRAYFHHQRFEGAEVYLRFGKQDITADVNFSLLREWGESEGLQTLHLETQRNFVHRVLGDEKIKKIADKAAQFLLQESGAGDAFQVLHQKVVR